MEGSGKSCVLLCMCLFVSSLFFLSDADDFFTSLPLAFFFLLLVVGYAKPCWRDGDARISNSAVCDVAALTTTDAVMC